MDRDDEISIKKAENGYIVKVHSMKNPQLKIFDKPKEVMEYIQTLL